MAYFIDLFSPETYEAFAQSSRNISGFRSRHKNVAGKIKPGDVFVCYLTRLSRWFGLLEVIEGPFTDNTPIFVKKTTPSPCDSESDRRCGLRSRRVFPFTRTQSGGSLIYARVGQRVSGWTGKVRGSLVRLDDQDGSFLTEKLNSQAAGGKTYPLSDQDKHRLARHTVNRPDKVVTVSVPEDTEPAEAPEVIPEDETRESIRIQALVANVGAKMGMSIWIPRADRNAVLRFGKTGPIVFLSDCR